MCKGFSRGKSFKRSSGSSILSFIHRYFPFTRGDGSPVWAHVTVSAIRDAEGRWLRSITTIEDISERKRAEEEVRRLNAGLEQRVVRRTAELAAFSYTVSHDLRAPLRHITGFVNLLEKGAAQALDEKYKRYLQVIPEAARRMAEDDPNDIELTLTALGEHHLASPVLLRKCSAMLQNKSS